MILLAGLLDVFCRALSFIGLALAVGGVAFDLLVIRPAARRTAVSPEATDAATRRSARLAVLGAIVVNVAQIGSLVIAPWALADDAGQWPVEAFLTTTFARAGLAHATAALLLAFAAVVIVAHPRARAPRVAAVVLALLTLATGGPLTHGASRLTHAVVLMTATVLHQLPSVLWIGGTIHLVAQWRLLRDGALRETLWPRMLARFSPLALTCVAGLLAAGLYLSWHYFNGPGGLVGTAYGWPLGPEPFFATLVAPEVIVHRAAAVVVIAAGLFEWRVRTGPLAQTRLRYAFPILCLLGGALLLTHSHSVFATKWAFLVEVSHNALGVFAVLAGATRWLELRLSDGPDCRVAAIAWPLCLTGIGLVLLFYRET